VPVLAAHAKADAPLLLTIVSGTPQSEPAYAGSSTNQYQTDFPKPLVVHLTSRPAKAPHVRYSCPAPHCTLRVPNEPDSGNRVSQSEYDVTTVHEQAALTIGLGTDLPGRYVVYAQAIPDGGPPGPKSAPFELEAR
jgi:hypothetical protein